MSNKINPNWGGKRPGAGRPKGSKSGPRPGSRPNRVVIMVTDEQWNTLLDQAERKGLALSTHAYELVKKAL